MYNILVVDDDKEIVGAIEIYLKKEGYNIIKAYNGNEAIQKIKEEFKTWKGAKLLSVSYTDDKRAEEELSYCNELKDGADFSECIVFESVFHSPKKDSGAWNPDQDYTGWQWYLARSGKEDWELLTWGY